MPDNGDKTKVFTVGGESVRGLGSFHKSLPHNAFGEVKDDGPYQHFLDATNPKAGDFSGIAPHDGSSARLTNPRAGLAIDHLTKDPVSYRMPAAPTVMGETIAAEMTELYWMALLRDAPFNALAADAQDAASEIDALFGSVAWSAGSPGANTGELLQPGVDIPGSAAAKAPITPDNVFRLGFPGDAAGPMLSQFFVRPAHFGTQTIDQRQRPYKSGRDYLTAFPDWLHAQNTGRDTYGADYPVANEHDPSMYENSPRYISTMRDLARFVNKDALHQAYFNACLILLSGKAKWTPGNPYWGDEAAHGPLYVREAGFGVLGGPHILALVSEVATRALKIVWHQKWQVHLRLRPEAYGGLVHVKHVGAANGEKKAYPFSREVKDTNAARRVFETRGSYLLPMAFSPGSPTHPAYGAGHATVAGACVTVLKAFFRMLDNHGEPIPFTDLLEKSEPYGAAGNIVAYETGRFDGVWDRRPLSPEEASGLTIEGELNKLAQNVAMGRSMGGVHWRTDNSRSLLLGQAIAAEILWGIVMDIQEGDPASVNPPASFQFRTFQRDAAGQPKTVTINRDGISVNGGAATAPNNDGYMSWHFEDFNLKPPAEAGA